jgi:hypothetical protein
MSIFTEPPLPRRAAATEAVTIHEH